jgi:hypothetical protein
MLKDIFFPDSLSTISFAMYMSSTVKSFSALTSSSKDYKSISNFKIVKQFE